MPELPEVETVVRGLQASILGSVVQDIVFFRDTLRDAIPIEELRQNFIGRPILQVFRRSKYIMLASDRGTALIHLGMSGNFLFERVASPLRPHTHVIFSLKNTAKEKFYLHFVDPRRFGRIGCHAGHDWQAHEFIAKLGVEPLDTEDLGRVLFEKGKNRQVAIKAHIMDAHVVVGIGNIYASESLFDGAIHPETKASALTLRDYRNLARAIKKTLEHAIAAGGTTLKDFRNHDGNNGYFAISLKVYGRAGDPCLKCRTIVSLARHSGRSTYFCQVCQKQK